MMRLHNSVVSLVYLLSHMLHGELMYDIKPKFGACSHVQYYKQFMLELSFGLGLTRGPEAKNGSVQT